MQGQGLRSQDLKLDGLVKSPLHLLAPVGRRGLGPGFSGPGWVPRRGAGPPRAVREDARRALAPREPRRRPACADAWALYPPPSGPVARASLAAPAALTARDYSESSFGWRSDKSREWLSEDTCLQTGPPPPAESTPGREPRNLGSPPTRPLALSGTGFGPQFACLCT